MALFSRSGNCSVITADLEASVELLMGESEREERTLVEVAVVGAGRREETKNKELMRVILAEGRRWSRNVRTIKQRSQRLLKNC